ncbi:hypothetical protein [Microbacterium sp. BK668]|uniref:hypothetical protein n=1 Tax=Microbacterium sp. BK668 TaxID=2512118 RepID=UPI00105F3FD4|nr:hypothetical protein [Microbacterium sp. BK668]TDN91951.1 hypothetical protein EV279_1460 [Microbacterium sp. BK668]
MDELVWGAVISSIVLVVAGVLVWWLWGTCACALTGAVGTVVGGVLALAPLLAVADQDVALRMSFVITVVTVVWLLSWSVASGIRGQRLAREAEAQALGAARGAAPRA